MRNHHFLVITWIALGLTWILLIVNAVLTGRTRRVLRDTWKRQQAIWKRLEGYDSQQVETILENDFKGKE
jgi:heme exporter protein D